MSKALLLSVFSMLSFGFAAYFTSEKNDELIKQINEINLETFRCVQTRQANIFYLERRRLELDTSEYELCERFPELEICPCGRLSRRSK